MAIPNPMNLNVRYWIESTIAFISWQPQLITFCCHNSAYTKFFATLFFFFSSLLSSSLLRCNIYQCKYLSDLPFSSSYAIHVHWHLLHRCLCVPCQLQCSPFDLYICAFAWRNMKYVWFNKISFGFKFVFWWNETKYAYHWLHTTTHGSIHIKETAQHILTFRSATGTRCK